MELSIATSPQLLRIDRVRAVRDVDGPPEQQGHMHHLLDPTSFAVLRAASHVSIRRCV
jgi:hypothetical protein